MNLTNVTNLSHTPVFSSKCVDGLSLQVVSCISVIVSAKSHSWSRVCTRNSHVKTHSPVSTVSFNYRTRLHHDLRNKKKNKQTVWNGMAWYGIVWHGMVWYGMVWYGMVWYCMAWYGLAWYGMAWHGMAWYGMVCNISNTRHSGSSHINTEKRVENTTRSGVFLTNFEVLDIVMKHCDECLI